MSKPAPAKKVTTPGPGAPADTAAKGIKKFPKNPPKGDGQYTWRVRRKLDTGDTPWKQGGPAEIMEVVLRRLEVLESFEKSTKEIERRINNLDKNILAVAKQFMPRPPKEPTPPPPKQETIMPRPPGAPAPPPVQEPILAMEESKKADEPKKAAPIANAPKKVAAGAAAAAPGAAGAKAGVKKFPKSK